MSIRGRRQSPSHGLTTPVDRLMRRHALTLCLLPLRADDGLVCACTHYLVFKEPTVCAPVAPSPQSRAFGCLADRVQGNLLRLLAPPCLVNPLFVALRIYFSQRHGRAVSSAECRSGRLRNAAEGAGRLPKTKKFAGLRASANSRCPCSGCRAPNVQ